MVRLYPISPRRNVRARLWTTMPTILARRRRFRLGAALGAYALLDHFADHYPDSIFVSTVPVLLANAHLQQSDPRGALAVLEPFLNTPEADEADYRYDLGRAYQLAGDSAQAAPIFRSLFATKPLSYEAAQAATQFQAMGTPLKAQGKERPMRT